MKIAFFSLGGTSGMYKCLIDQFVREGHYVTLITPVYHKSSCIKYETPFLTVLYFRSLPIEKIGLIKKGFANLVFPYLCSRAICKFLNDLEVDMILATTPPLGFYSSIKKLKRKNPSCKFYMILRDILPEGGKLLGLDKKFPIVYSYFRMLEKKYYKIADYIGCMSPGNIDFVKHSNPEVSFEKYRLLPNWGNPEVYQAPDMRIRKAYDLDGKYVLVYGGNMGRPQGLDTFLELARMKREFSDVVFLFIGNGTERKRLIEKKELLHLDNVRFMDFIPKTDLIQLMRTCDVGLISLNKDLATPSIPSKTIDYWKIKLPILAAVDAVTDYGYNILDTTRSGVWALATDMEKLSEQFDLLYSRPELRKVFGENGYNYLHEECSSAKTYSRIIEVLH